MLHSISSRLLPLVTTCAALAMLSTLGHTAQGQGYVQTNLVADQPGIAATTDPHLVNPWGFSFFPGSPFWVSNNHTGTSTLYNSAGHVIPLVVTIPGPAGSPAGFVSAPTGQVANGTTDFQVAPGKPGAFIFATEDGTISAWNPDVSLHQAILAVDNSASKAVYKGLAEANWQGETYLYAADFRNNKIDVIDETWEPVTLAANRFVDPKLPAGYAPFNIQNVNGNLYVEYALQDSTRHDEQHGIGWGYVDVYTTGGRLLHRLQHGWWFNAPWGVAIAPAGFGQFADDILIGNFGSGWIAAFNPMTYKFEGLVSDKFGYTIQLPGLWGIAFGGTGSSGDPNTLYFAAGPNGEANGLFGSISVVP